MALKVHQLALDTIRRLAPVVRQIAKHDRSLADQLRRAASSIVLNIAEAEGSRGGTQRTRFDSACGSAKETRAALEVAAAWGYLSTEQATTIESNLDGVIAILWRLAGR